MNSGEILNQVREKIRDESGNVFSDDVILSSLDSALHSLFPVVRREYREDVVILPAGDSSFSVSSSATTAGTRFGVPAELAGVFYYADGRRVDLTGWYVQDNVVYLDRPLRVQRQVGVLWIAPYVIDDTFSDVAFARQFLPVVEHFAIADVLDGYFVGRIPYDKYSVTASASAVDPYEVQSAARHFRELAESERARICRSLPPIRTR